MPSWIKDDYRGGGYLLIRYKDGITELNHVPCSKSCEIQEIKEYGKKLFELYGSKYEWIKVYDSRMRLLDVIK